MRNLLFLLLAVLMFSCNSKDKQIVQNEGLKTKNKELNTYRKRK